MSLTFLMFVLIAFIGLGAGVLAGMFGIGGGLLINPMLIAALGLPAELVVGSGTCQIIGASTSGILRRWHSGTIDWTMALTLAGGSTLGVGIGLSILEWAKHSPPLRLGGQSVRTAEFLVLTLLMMIMLGLAIFLAWEARRSGGQSPVRRIGLLSGLRLPPYGDYKSLESPRMSIPAVVVIGLLAGVSTGLLGIGGGVLLFPSLVFLMGQRTVRAAGTSLAVTWFSSVVGGGLHAWNGNVHLGLLAALLTGSTIGAQIGSMLGMRISGVRLRMIFVVVLLLLSAVSAWKLARLLTE